MPIASVNVFSAIRATRSFLRRQWEEFTCAAFTKAVACQIETSKAMKKRSGRLRGVNMTKKKNYIPHGKITNSGLSASMAKSLRQIGQWAAAGIRDDGWD